MTPTQPPVRKVLMTADTVGGVWTYALDLCRAFTAQNIDVHLATMGSPLSPGQQSEASVIRGLYIHQSDYKLEWMENPWKEVDEAGDWLLSLEKQLQPDVIHLNGYVHAALNWSAPVIVAAHSCVLSWWQAVKKEAAPAYWDEYRHRVTKGLNAADMVVAISDAYAADLKKLYGPIDNLTVIYNGRDQQYFYTADKKMQAFAMGRIWDEAKNLQVLGKLVNNNRLPVIIAGNNLRPGTNEPAVTIPHVQLPGILTPAQVREQLSQSFIYILPAKYEPFGLSVLEAALSGCLLLLADIPTLRELWQDTALYFNPDKPYELDAWLDKIVQQPENYQYLIERSTKRAKYFSLQRMVKQYLNVYALILQKQLIT